jgi:RNA polymerase sigma factor (TIGR02999 family)
MSSDTPPNEVTRLLQSAEESDSAEQLLGLVYDQLRKIAQQRMAEERVGHTLQATALVHEAYLRLTRNTEVSWQGRAHFFSAASEAMRKILIDHARKCGAQKRGSGIRAVSGVLDLASNEKEIGHALALDELILRLEKEDSQAARVVQLRFYAGLSVEETAEILDISRRTAARDWAFARAWLAEQIEDVS